MNPNLIIDSVTCLLEDTDLSGGDERSNCQTMEIGKVAPRVELQIPSIYYMMFGNKSDN